MGRPDLRSVDPMQTTPATECPDDEASTSGIIVRPCGPATSLQAVIDALPIAVMVQNERGEVLCSNNSTADHLLMPADVVRESLATMPLRTPFVIEGDNVANPGQSAEFQTVREHIRIENYSCLISTAVDVTAQRRRETELARRAYFDDLTGLPNRRLLEEHVNAKASAASPGKRFALVFLDLDHFKQINDFYGHAVGDGLLVELTKRISRSIRETDMLSRISGDEFLLLLDPVCSETEAAGMLEGLFDDIRRPVYVDGFEIFASASAGMSVFPEHGLDYGSLRHNADIAMYKVKGQDRGGLAVFNIGMQQDAVLKMESEQRLRQAILDRHVCCAYQPKVNIRTQEVEGVEALVRLRNEEGIVQAPANFIDLAVELGLIDDLAHLVLDEIRGSIDLIDEMFGQGVRVSVNVAAKQAANEKFMTGFAEALSSTGFPDRFMVEITEDAFISKSKFQTEILPMLRDIGVGISIDDFGVGYSSLSALADITADELKIDRAFITDIHMRPRSQSILKAIESLSEALNMKVIAEGVETIEEVTYLQTATRINFAQGYYFSKPMFIEEFGASKLRSRDRYVVDPARITDRRGSSGRMVDTQRQNFRFW